MSAYLCPDDSEATQYAPPTIQYVQTSYAPVRGATENIAYSYGTATTATNADRCGAVDSEGVFGESVAYKIRDILDGTSNTFAYGEVSRFRDDGSNPHTISNLVAYWGGPASPGWPGDVRISGGAFTFPKLNARANKANASTVLAPCHTSAGWGTPDCLNFGQWGFRSNHAGGANFLYCDGSVKFIKETIGSPTYMALGSRAGGEVISADQQ